MKFSILALKDEALHCYNRPIFDSNDEEKIKVSFGRSMLADVREHPAVASKYIGNHLDLVGEFDDETGVIVPVVPVKVLVECNKVLGVKEEGEKDGTSEGK